MHAVQPVVLQEVCLPAELTLDLAMHIIWQLLNQNLPSIFSKRQTIQSFLHRWLWRWWASQVKDLAVLLICGFILRSKLSLKWSWGLNSDAPEQSRQLLSKVDLAMLLFPCTLWHSCFVCKAWLGYLLHSIRRAALAEYPIHSPQRHLDDCVQLSPMPRCI